MYTVRPVIGPMARDFDSLLLLTQAILSPNMSELDPLVPPLPFDVKVRQVPFIQYSYLFVHFG